MKGNRIIHIAVFDTSIKDTFCVEICREAEREGDTTYPYHTYNLNRSQISQLSDKLYNMLQRGTITVRPFLGGGLGYVVTRKETP